MFYNICLGVLSYRFVLQLYHFNTVFKQFLFEGTSNRYYLCLLGFNSM